MNNELLLILRFLMFVKFYSVEIFDKNPGSRVRRIA